MKDELLDFVDRDNNVIGQILRSQIDATDYIRRMAAVMVFDSMGRVMICRNAKSKSGMEKWKYSSIGHIRAGEEPDVAAAREAYEEIGIKINPDDLCPMAIVDMSDDKVGFKRFQHVFRAVSDGPFNIDAREIMDYKFLTPDELSTEIDRNPIIFTHAFIKFWKGIKQ